MKSKFLFFLLFIPFMVQSQFGFERTFDIEVIRNSVQKKYPWVGGLDYCQYSNIDLNQDGVQDLFIFDRTCDKILTFIQNGAVGQIDLIYAPEYENQFPDLKNWVLLVDYDGDGKKDIFSSSPGGVKVYKNDSNTNLYFSLKDSFLQALINNTPANVHVNSWDIPAIIDIDNDGDLDILAFNTGSQANCVRYHKNLSMETYGVIDSLSKFKVANVCWGNFTENGSSNMVSLNDCCSAQVTNPESETNPRRPIEQGQDRHAGSTVLALDLNANGVLDLILGDASNSSMIMLMNGGTSPNTNSSMISQDITYPSYDIPINMPVLLGAYYCDVNNDNIRDLLVSPNAEQLSQNFESNWLYINNGADNFPDFEFEEIDFLQGEMIEHGSGSLPVFFDHNADGLKDLIISIDKKYDTVSTNYFSTMAYYENTGTVSNPEYTFITDDYHNMSSFGGGFNLRLYPTFGDIDGDGDEDMIVSEYQGYLYLFKNVAGPGSPALYTSGLNLVGDNVGNFINQGIQGTPKLIDLNRDGLLDIVIGKRNGFLAYYENVGTASNYEFELITTALGNVDVSTTGSTEGYAVPEFVDIDNEYKLIVGKKTGELFYYGNIDGNLSGSFSLLSNHLDNVNIGDFSAPAIADIDGDNKLEMVLGNQRGGVALFESISIVDSTFGVKNENLNFKIYPNPAKEQLNIFIEDSDLLNSKLEIRDLRGKLVYECTIQNKTTIVNSANLARGIYILKINSKGHSKSSKIVLD